MVLLSSPLTQAQIFAGPLRASLVPPSGVPPWGISVIMPRHRASPLLYQAGLVLDPPISRPYLPGLLLALPRGTFGLCQALALIALIFLILAGWKRRFSQPRRFTSWWHCPVSYEGEVRALRGGGRGWALGIGRGGVGSECCLDPEDGRLWFQRYSLMRN